MGNDPDKTGNAKAIERAISSLDSDYNFPGFIDALAAQILGQRAIVYPDFKAFWARVREINEMFNESDLHGNDRRELRQSLSALCETAKSSQQEYRSSFEQRCNENRNKIDSAIRNLISRHDLEWISTIS